MPPMTTAVQVVTSTEGSVSKKGSDVMLKSSHEVQGFGVADLLSPAALRIELLGAVALVLAAGRIFPEVGELLRQFSALLFG
jgi:hypothetical protein